MFFVGLAFNFVIAGLTINMEKSKQTIKKTLLLFDQGNAPAVWAACLYFQKANAQPQVPTFVQQVCYGNVHSAFYVCNACVHI